LVPDAIWLSIKHALVGEGGVQLFPPNDARVLANPVAGYAEL
jgi:hypothetical protein